MHNQLILWPAHLSDVDRVEFVCEGLLRLRQSSLVERGRSFDLFLLIKAVNLNGIL